MKLSLNRKLILTPYKKSKEIKTSVSGGILTIDSTKNADFLELLVDTTIDLGQNRDLLLEAGTKVFFAEHTLQTQKWPRDIMKSEHFGEFVVANANDILYIETKE